jgi:nucleotide-binding universal stress UspA family protein
MRRAVILVPTDFSEGADVALDVAARYTRALGGRLCLATEILRYAKRHPIDLIVVGTHGHAGATRELLGNVADRVVRSARCPVLVVPAPAGSRPARRRPAR